jgi:hypothetical protein
VLLVFEIISLKKLVLNCSTITQMEAEKQRDRSFEIIFVLQIQYFTLEQISFTINFNFPYNILLLN